MFISARLHLFEQLGQLGKDPNPGMAQEMGQLETDVLSMALPRVEALFPVALTSVALTSNHRLDVKVESTASLHLPRCLPMVDKNGITSFSVPLFLKKRLLVVPQTQTEGDSVGLVWLRLTLCGDHREKGGL